MTVTDFQVLPLVILLGISILCLALRKSNLFGFFFMGTILAALFLVMGIGGIKKQNKRIAGVYQYNWADPQAIEEWNGVKVPDSCRIILSKNLDFRIENCPAFIPDSTGYWTARENTNHSWVRFTDKNKVETRIRLQFPFNEIHVVIDANHEMVFTKVD
jgi:hypothetical protein